ncbi:MAG: c-type cytochrome biogenesis protein CcmI [Paracoccaceae bacterium]
MLTFYLIAGGIALVVTVLMVRPLLTGGGGAVSDVESDTQVFKDQLSEIERDLERGIIRPEDAAGARVEVSRRLLAAAKRVETRGAGSTGPQGISGMAAGLALIGTPALAVAMYFGLGAPGIQDQPLAERVTARNTMPEGHPAPSQDRPSQAQAEAAVAGDIPPAPEGFEDSEYQALVAQLEETVAARPDDAQGHQLLANGLMRLGRWSDAVKTYQQAIDILGEQASAEIHANQAEAMVLATGGYVSPEAESAIGRALQINPSLDIARYYAGLALRQGGRLDDAITVWEGLRRDSSPSAPYMEYLNLLLSETIQARDQMTGGQMAGAPAIAGPTQEDMAAAGELPPEDRQDMIQGMVARLAARLAEQGGSPDEWAQLMASYTVLDQMDDARGALEQAVAAYPTGPASRMLMARAAELGLVDASAVPATTPLPGPTQEDIAAAAQMSPDDQQAMIQNMVARLDNRLTTDGGTAEEWLRLLNAYVQLDRMDDATRIYKLAYVALDNDPSQGFVKEQALLMGIPVE